MILRCSHPEFVLDAELELGRCEPLFGGLAIPLLGLDIALRHADSGMYHAHTDCDLEQDGPRCRKLSVTLNLSDPDTLRRQGATLVFPSFLEHRVTPLFAGELYSLVAWLCGPNWR